MPRSVGSKPKALEKRWKSAWGEGFEENECVVSGMLRGLDFAGFLPSYNEGQGLWSNLPHVVDAGGRRCQLNQNSKKQVLMNKVVLFSLPLSTLLGRGYPKQMISRNVYLEYAGLALIN